MNNDINDLKLDTSKITVGGVTLLINWRIFDDSESNKSNDSNNTIKMVI